MAKVKIGTPPTGLKGDELQNWFTDQFEDAYERQLFDHREARRKAEAALEEKSNEIDELKKQLPSDDSVLLKGKDAEKWAELQKVDLDDLRVKALAGERMTRHAFLREVAEASGYNPKTFAELVELRDVKIEKLEGEDGKVQYAVAIDNDGETEHKPVTEHFEQAYSDWLPALAPPEARGGAPTTLRPPPLGRLPSGPPRRPDDPQRAYVEKAKAEAARSRNVVLQALTRNTGGTDE